MKYTWDENKYRTNLLKHGIRFEEAQSVFADVHAIEIDDTDSDDELRFVMIGKSTTRGVLVVVYCERYHDIIRIISARKATKTEVRQYEERI